MYEFSYSGYITFYARKQKRGSQKKEKKKKKKKEKKRNRKKLKIYRIIAYFVSPSKNLLEKGN